MRTGEPRIRGRRVSDVGLDVERRGGYSGGGTRKRRRAADSRRPATPYESSSHRRGVQRGDRWVAAQRNPTRFAAPAAPSGRRSLRRQAGVEPKRRRRSRHRMLSMPSNPHGRFVDYRRPRPLAAARDLRHDRRQRGDLHPGGRLFRVRVELGRRLSFGSQFRAMHPAVFAPPIGTRSPPGRRGMGTVHLPPRSEPSLPPRPQLPYRGRDANPQSLTQEPGLRDPELLGDSVEIVKLASGHVHLDGPVERLGVWFMDELHRHTRTLELTLLGDPPLGAESPLQTGRLRFSRFPGESVSRDEP